MPIAIRTESAPLCKLCSSKGIILYSNMKDIIGTVDGEWSIKRCQGCDLLWLDPMPIKEDIALAYTEYPTHEVLSPGPSSIKDRIKRGYVSIRYGVVEGVSYFDKMLGSILWLLPTKRVSTDFWYSALRGIKKGRLLDIGSGSGELVKQMNEWGWQAEGIDPDINAVENARSKGLIINHGDFLRHDYQEGSFDAVISSHVFEHVHEPVGFLRRCWGLLKTGGRLVIATPNAASWQHRLFKQSWMPLDPPRHLFLFTPRSIALCALMAEIPDFRIITTARGSRFIAAASMHLLKNPSYHWRDKPDTKSRYVSQVIEVLETFLLSFMRDRGIEIQLSADKI